jgi:hypothetical protein
MTASGLQHTPCAHQDSVINPVFMKQYLIDELRPDEHLKIKKYLDEKYATTVFNGLHWIQLEQTQYTKIQTEHTECQPFYVALNLEPSLLTCELLVRTQNRLRCACMGYATEKQRNWLFRLVDDMFDQLKIKC